MVRRWDKSSGWIEDQVDIPCMKGWQAKVDTKVGAQVSFWYDIPSLKSILESIDRAAKGVTIIKMVSNI